MKELIKDFIPSNRPSDMTPKGIRPYVWAAVIIVLTGALMVLAILMLRPLSDPVDIITRVGGYVAATVGGVLAFMKSQETHLSVNGRLDAFMQEHGQAKLQEGLLKGAAIEQSRAAAEQAAIQVALNTPVPAPSPAPATTVIINDPR